jgi:hypothetical protein
MVARQAEADGEIPRFARNKLRISQLQREIVSAVCRNGEPGRAGTFPLVARNDEVRGINIFV